MKSLEIVYSSMNYSSLNLVVLPLILRVDITIQMVRQSLALLH